MKINRIFFLFLTFSLFLISCKTSQLQIEKPKESYIQSQIKPAMSEFPLSIQIDVEKLQSAVNKKMTGLIYEGNNLNNQDLSVKIWKVQDFDFKINNNVIEYKIPLKLWTRFAWKFEKFGLSMSDHYEANGSIALSYKTTISIDKNWNLVAKTTSTGFQWLEAPKINVIGIDVPVTSVANIALSKGNQLITNQIDLALSQMVELKKYVYLAWTQAHEPIQVNEENNIWIRISPSEVYVSPFTSKDSKLLLGLSLYGQVESFMGSRPDKLSVKPLPDFKLVQRAAQQFNLNLATDVTYDKISELSKSQLINKTFTQGKRSITITDLSIYGSEGKPIFVADVIGSLKGRIYFTGNMVYNSEKKSVDIQNPEFDVKTKSALLKSADWLLHGFILNKLTPYLSYPVQQDLDDLKLEANQMLKNYLIMDGVSMEGNLNNLTVTDLNLVPGAVRITTNIKGNMAIKVDELKL